MDKEIGKRYGKLVVLKFSHKNKYNGKYYLFKCDCGKEKIIYLNNVKTGKTKSCGCLRNEDVAKRFKKYNQFIKKDGYVVGYTNKTNKEFFIDEEDLEKVKMFCWYEQSNGYITNKNGKKAVLLHRYIMNANDGDLVDHINHNKKDNRKINLRITNRHINGLNKTEIPKGICKHKSGKNIYYVVQLNGYRGNFKNYEDALRLRNQIIENEYMPLREGVRYE